MTNDFCYDDFIKWVEVPRETFSQLQNFVNLLKKWQPKINLISNSTISEIWERHIIDSSQLKKFISDHDRVVDLGSGGGFPGIVLSILGVKNITLIESDSRKAEFLKEAARVGGLKTNVICQRVEKIPLDEFDVIAARGLASLGDILSMLAPTLREKHKLLLLKGKTFEHEVRRASQEWSFNCQQFQSVTDPEGVVAFMEHIVKIKQNQKVAV